MPKFKIEMELSTSEERILLADFPAQSDTITFNEELTEEENDRYVLNFSLPEKVDNINFQPLINIGRPLWLHFSSPVRSVRMVIVSYNYDYAKENKIYNIEAQDYASYVFSRNNVGLTLDTIHDEIFLDWLNTTVAPTINL